MVGSASHAEWRSVHRRIFSCLPSWWSQVVRSRGLVLVCFQGLCQFISSSCGHTHDVKDRVQNNNHNHNHNTTTHHNNHDTIWGGSVLKGEEPPPHSGELKHALSQAGGPPQSQLSRPMSSGHHISMEHRLRRKQLNSDTNASNETFLKEIQEQRKEETFSSEKMKKENEKH